MRIKEDSDEPRKISFTKGFRIKEDSEEARKNRVRTTDGGEGHVNK